MGMSVRPLASVRNEIAPSASVPWPANIETILLASYSTRTICKPLDTEHTPQAFTNASSANTRRSTSLSPRPESTVQPSKPSRNASKYAPTSTPAQSRFRECCMCWWWLVSMFSRKSRRVSESAQQLSRGRVTVSMPPTPTAAATALDIVRKSTALGHPQYNGEEKKSIFHHSLWSGLEQKENEEAATIADSAQLKSPRNAVGGAVSGTRNIAWASDKSVHCSSQLICAGHQPQGTIATHSCSSSSVVHSTFQSQLSVNHHQLPLVAPQLSHLRNNSF